MTVKAPPIQEKTTGILGKFPQVWIKWFNSVKDSINALENKVTTIEDDPHIAAAIKQIYLDFGDTVSIKDNDRACSLRKFGRNGLIGTTIETVMEFQGAETHEDYPSTNSIDYVVCDDAAFTGTVAIQGKTISGTNLTNISQTATLNGHTPVAITPMARAERVFINNGDELAATSNIIYVFEGGAATNGIPDTSTDTHVLCSGLYNQSQKCAISTQSDEYIILTNFYGGALKKTTAVVNVTGQIKDTANANFRTVIELGAKNGEYFILEEKPYPIVPPNHDIRIMGESSAASTEVTACFSGYLAKIQ